MHKNNGKNSVLAIILFCLGDDKEAAQVAMSLFRYGEKSSSKFELVVQS